MVSLTVTPATATPVAGIPVVARRLDTRAEGTRRRQVLIRTRCRMRGEILTTESLLMQMGVIPMSWIRFRELL